MPRKPIVAYVETENDRSFSDNGNPGREALIYHLKGHHDCEVLCYSSEYWFERDLARLKQLVDAGMILLVIVKQTEHGDEQHQTVIRLTRSELGEDLPINVIPEGFLEERFVGDPDKLSYAFDHTDVGLTDLVASLHESWKQPHNWFGTESRQEDGLLYAQLEIAYRHHHLGEKEEAMLGVPDHNGQVVAEAIRLRLLPSSLIKAEFDDTLVYEQSNFVPIESGLYQKECAKIAGMSADEREVLCSRLSLPRGEITHGGDVSGFAMDPVTLEFATTSQMGLHHAADRQLSTRVELIEALRGRKHWCDIEPIEAAEIRWRFITGLIFKRIPGFTTPILKIYMDDSDQSDIEDARRVARQVRAEQKFIPINGYGRLLGD